MVDYPLGSRFFSVLMYFTLRFGILKPFWIDAEQGGSECRAWRFISFCLTFSRLYTHTESTSRLLLLREPFTLKTLHPSHTSLTVSSSLNRCTLQSRLGIHTHTLLNYLALYFFFPITLVWFFSAVSLFQNYGLFFSEQNQQFSDSGTVFLRAKNSAYNTFQTFHYISGQQNFLFPF